MKSLPAVMIILGVLFVPALLVHFVFGQPQPAVRESDFLAQAPKGGEPWVGWVQIIDRPSGPLWKGRVTQKPVINYSHSSSYSTLTLHTVDDGTVHATLGPGIIVIVSNKEPGK